MADIVHARVGVSRGGGGVEVREVEIFLELRKAA